MPTRSIALAAVTICLAACGPQRVPPTGSHATTPKPSPPAASLIVAPAAAVAQTATMASHGTEAPNADPTALPKGHPAIDGGGFTIAPAPKEAGSGARSLRWAVPKGWIAETPASTMRRAQYRVPGPGGDAECVVFYFGPGQGGDALSNAGRWASQFHLPDGGDGQSAMKTREMSADGMVVLVVEVAGTYVGGLGSATPGDKSDYALLGAIAKGPDANWFFKLVGPGPTVAAERAVFEQLVRSLKKGT